MLDRNFLLIYRDIKGVKCDWFESEDHLRAFVKRNKSEILEINNCLNCTNATEIEIEVK